MFKVFYQPDKRCVSIFPFSVLFSYKLSFNVALDNYTFSPNNADSRHQYCPASILNNKSIELS